MGRDRGMLVVGRCDWWWEFRDVLIRPLVPSFDFAKRDRARQGQRIGACDPGSHPKV